VFVQRAEDCCTSYSETKAKTKSIQKVEKQTVLEAPIQDFPDKIERDIVDALHLDI